MAGRDDNGNLLGVVICLVTNAKREDRMKFVIALSRVGFVVAVVVSFDHNLPWWWWSLIGLVGLSAMWPTVERWY